MSSFSTHSTKDSDGDSSPQPAQTLLPTVANTSSEEHQPVSFTSNTFSLTPELATLVATFLDSQDLWGVGPVTGNLVDNMGTQNLWPDGGISSNASTNHQHTPRQDLQQPVQPLLRERRQSDGFESVESAVLRACFMNNSVLPSKPTWSATPSPTIPTTTVPVPELPVELFDMIASFMPPSELWRLRSLCRTFHPIALLHITSKASSASDVRSIAELFNSLIPSASPAFIGRLLKPKNFDGRALARFFALLSCINKSPSACGKLLRELGLSLEGLLAVLDQWDFDLKGVGKTVLELGLGIDEKLEVLAFLSLEKGLQGDSLVQAVIDSSDEPFSNEHLVRLFHLSEPYFDDVLRVVEVLLTSGRKNVSDVAELIRGLHFGPNETVMMLKNLPLDWSESGRVLRALTLPAASLASTLVGLRLGNDMVALSKVFKELELDRRGMIDVLRRMQLRHIRDYGCLARELGLSRDTHTVAGIINHIEAPGPYALASLLRQLSLNTKEMATLLGHIDLAREYDEADDSPALARILIGLGLSMADLADVLGHLFASGHLTKIGLKVTVGALWKQTTLSVLELIDLLDEFPLMGILSRDEVVGVLEDLVPFRNPDELCLLRWAPCLMMTSARTQVAV